MIIVYEANTSIDANIVQDLLSLEGINSHIMGGYLEGAIGEIQTMGVIKLMVDKQDYNQARAVIADWENQKIEEHMDDDCHNTSHEPNPNNDYIDNQYHAGDRDQTNKGSKLSLFRYSAWFAPAVVSLVVLVYLLLRFLMPMG